METYGYVRVSSKDQNEDRQLIAIRELNVEPDHVFIDKQSGKDFCRPEYLKLMEVISPGDLIYVKSIDRLGRDYEDTEPMADHHKREKSEYCSDRYAAFGHTQRKRSGGHISE